MTQKRDSTSDTVLAGHINVDLRADDVSHPTWERAAPVSITRYWSGAEAPPGRHSEVRISWSDAALHLRFICNQTEPLIVSSNPRVDKKTIGLWDRDVCEIFVAPDPQDINRYFEFEAAPTGEWIDLAIHLTPERRETDWEFRSGMTVSGRFDSARVTIGMRIPWDDWIHKPQRGEKWRTNLFRCVGSGETRGYLAWQPTLTKQANFHVPQVFGWLRFA
jgi:hypothetical protein